MLSSAYRIEKFSLPYVAEACQLERASGLHTSGEATMLARLLDPHSLILMAVEANCPTATPALVGLFCGWVVIDELEVDNLVVAPAAKRQGIGRALLMEALHLAWQRGTKKAYLEVRESNLAAISLYELFGFRQVGKRRGYYSQPIEDALVLRLDQMPLEINLNLRQS